MASTPGARSVFTAAAMCAVLATAASLAVAVRTGANLTVLAAVGETHEPPLWRDGRLPDWTAVQRGQDGYDGQYYLVMALEPLGADPAIPAARRQRLLFPLLGWLLSAGDPELAVYALAAVGVAAAGIGGLFAGLWLRERGLAAWWATLAGANAGVLLGAQYLCPDGLMICLLMVSVWLIGRDRWVAATLAMAGATLAKEAALVPWLGAVLGLAWHREDRRARLLVLAPLPWIVWVCLLSFRMGEFAPAWNVQDQLGAPGAAWLAALIEPLRDPGARAIGPCVLALAAPIGIVLAAQRLRGPEPLVASAALVTAVSAFGWAPAVWDHVVGAARNMAPLLLLGVLLSAAAPRRWPALGFASLALASSTLAIVRAFALGAVPEIALAVSLR